MPCEQYLQTPSRQTCEGYEKKYRPARGSEPDLQGAEAEFRVPAKHAEDRQKCDAAERNDKEKEFLQPLLINVHRILGGRYRAIGQDVHHLDGFHRPEADGGLQHQDAEEQAAPAGDGPGEEQEILRRGEFRKLKKSEAENEERPG